MASICRWNSRRKVALISISIGLLGVSDCLAALFLYNGTPHQIEVSAMGLCLGIMTGICGLLSAFCDQYSLYCMWCFFLGYAIISLALAISEINGTLAILISFWAKFALV
eukprot:347504_1